MCDIAVSDLFMRPNSKSVLTETANQQVTFGQTTTFGSVGTTVGSEKKSLCRAIERDKGNEIQVVQAK